MTEKIKTFIEDYSEGLIFGSNMIPEHLIEDMLPRIFLPLALGGLSNMSEEQTKDIALVYEYNKECCNRLSVNGFPIFFSCRFLTFDEWETARQALIKIEEAKNSILEEGSENLETASR